jgi:predicted permease
MVHLLNRLRLWLRAVLYGRRLDREMREEVSAHLARSTDDWVSRGLTTGEARAAARREFGHVESIHEAGRDARGVRGIESLAADLLYGFRHLRRTPVTTSTMVVVMALGLGFNSFVFVVIHSFVTSLPAGMTPQDRLVRIRGIDHGSFRGRAIGREFSYPEYRQYESQTRLFSETAAWASSDAVLDVGTREENLQSGAATYVTSRYFQVLGLSPIAGAGLPTDLRDDDPAPPLVAVISDALWARYYDRSTDAIGRTMKVNDVPVTIVGVAPRRFAGARTGGSHIRVWLPLATRPQLQRADPILTNDDAAIFGVIGRLAPGVRVEDTAPTVSAIARQATQLTTRPISFEVWSTDVVPLLADNYFPPSGEESAGFGPYVALMIPLLVLVITCTNVSALLAGRAVARTREVAVRIALGASRGRVVRQLVTESVLAAVAAGLLGLGVIWLLIRVFDVTIPDMDIHFGLDWRGVLFTFVLAMVTGVVFGLAPALQATRVAVAETIKDAGGVVVTTRSRLQAGLVVAQIAFTQPALLAMGTLLLEVTSDYLRRPTSAQADRVVDARFNTNPRYGTLDDTREAALARVQATLAGVPGVVSVVPQALYDDYFHASVHPDDQRPDADSGEFELSARRVPAEYFGVLDIPIVRGRNFSAQDSRASGAIIIGADVARRLWGDADPIGRRLEARSDRGVSSVLTVVGVVHETVAGASGAGREHRIYVPYSRGITSHFLIRTHGPAQPLIPAIRAAANRAAPEQPLIRVQTLAQIEAADRTTVRRAMAGIGGSGLVALFLSAIGLYAVVTFAVGQRVREIGIRTALGAGRTQVVNLFLFRGLRLTLGALVLGLTISLIVVKLLAVSRGDTVDPATPWLAAIVAVIVIAVALVASWIPARRAAMVDPLQALRTD